MACPDYHRKWGQLLIEPGQRVAAKRSAEAIVSLFTWKSLFAVRPKQPRSRRPASLRPRIESLEERRLLSATWLVDDDLAQRPDADFTSIQAAVDAASAGDTIQVFPGTYFEAVEVDKTLSILGAQRAKNPRTRSIDPAKESIVDTPAIGLAGFHLSAPDITINGFTIQDVDGLPGLPSAGIATSAGASGYQILKNRIQHNTVGVDLESNGVETTVVQSNYFNDNNQIGPGSGRGIFSDGPLSDAQVRANYFTAHAIAAMEFDGASGLSIRGSTIVGDAPVLMDHVTDSEVINNSVKNAKGDGISLSACSDVLVDFNRITGAGGQRHPPGGFARQSRGRQRHQQERPGRHRTDECRSQRCPVQHHQIQPARRPAPGCRFDRQHAGLQRQRPERRTRLPRRFAGGGHGRNRQHVDVQRRQNRKPHGADSRQNQERVNECRDTAC